jgi:uncharacterized protein Usg
VFLPCILDPGRISFVTVPAAVPGFADPEEANAPKPYSQRTDSMNIALQLQDYRLTTAEILYHLPDHPRLLQTYIWQELDLAPGYPALHKFLDFWDRELDGKVHSVRVATAKLVKPVRYRHPGAWMRLH